MTADDGKPTTGDGKCPRCNQPGAVAQFDALGCYSGHLCPQCVANDQAIRQDVRQSESAAHVKAKDDNGVKCAKCGSSQVTAQTKGFGLGKAAAGGLLLGPVGLLGGLIGSRKVKVVCLHCGHAWHPGS